MKKVFLRHLQIESPYVDPAHDKLRVLHLTDLHIKPKTKLNFIFQVIQNYSPKIVVLTGDYVCYDTESLWRLTGFLNQIAIKKYATLGNHDHWTDPVAVVNALKAGGCVVLQNQSIQENLNEQNLNIIGIDDKITKNDNVEKAYSEIIPQGTSLVLSHVGDVIDDLVKYKSAIILAGHTHAGQIKVPWLTKRLLNAYGLKHHYGFYQKEDQLVYISSGLGESVPIRWRAEPEICIFDFYQNLKTAYKLINSELVS